MHVDAGKKGQKGREKVINKKRHPSIWTDTSEWEKWEGETQSFYIHGADEFSNFSGFLFHFLVQTA